MRTREHINKIEGYSSWTGIDCTQPLGTTPFSEDSIVDVNYGLTFASLMLTQQRRWGYESSHPHLPNIRLTLKKKWLTLSILEGSVEFTWQRQTKVVTMDNKGPLLWGDVSRQLYLRVKCSRTFKSQRSGDIALAMISSLLLFFLLMPVGSHGNICLSLLFSFSS